MNFTNSLLPGWAIVLAAMAHAQITTFCPPQTNSSGAPTSLTGAFGSGGGSGLHLEVSGGVPGEFGYFLVGDQATSPLAISNGVLCLGTSPGASVFRYNLPSNGWSSIGQFDSAGVLQNMAGTSLTGSGFDVPSMIPSGVPTTITVGDTWHFQFWHRDTPFAAGASNLSNGLSATFHPPGVPLPGMVVIPPGTFAMGSNAAPGAPYFGRPDQQPVHTVTISQGFWMGATEVTQTQYQTLMGVNPSEFIGANRPVERVSWLDAQAFCAALTSQQSALGNVPSGYEYRLPTEAEWEYACRAGSSSEFHTGPTLVCTDARFWFSYHSGADCTSDSTVAVASYGANAFGLYDMHGNVREWCLDSYVPYSPGAVTDPFSGILGFFPVVRNGGWNAPSHSCGSAFRYWLNASGSNNELGFRVVLAPVVGP